MVTPGTYRVSLWQEGSGQVAKLAEEQSFEVVAWESSTLPAQDRTEVLRFREKPGSYKRLVDIELRDLDVALERAGAPWTPGRRPN